MGNYSEPFDEYVARSYVHDSKKNRRLSIARLREKTDPYGDDNSEMLVDLKNVMAFYPTAIPTLLMRELDLDQQRVSGVDQSMNAAELERLKTKIRFAEGLLYSMTDGDTKLSLGSRLKWWRVWLGRRRLTTGPAIDFMISSQNKSELASERLDNCIESLENGGVVIGEHFRDETYIHPTTAATGALGGNEPSENVVRALRLEQEIEDDRQRLLVKQREVLGRAVILNSSFEGCSLGPITLPPIVVMATRFTQCCLFVRFIEWEAIECSFIGSEFYPPVATLTDAVVQASRSLSEGEIQDSPLADWVDLIRLNTGNCGRFSGVVFEECQFIGVDWSSSIFVGCRFRNIGFREDEWNNPTRMDRVHFVDCVFEDLTFEDSLSLEGTVFDGCEFVGCRSMSARFAGSRFIGCDLSGMDWDEEDFKSLAGAESIGSYRIGARGSPPVDQLITDQTLG